MVKGVLNDLQFFIGDYAIPTVSERSVKSLGRCYDASLKDKDQVKQLCDDIKAGLPGNLKS